MAVSHSFHEKKLDQDGPQLLEAFYEAFWGILGKFQGDP